MDRIHLTDVAFPCIIGMYARERERPQRLELELSLGLSLEAAADGDFEHTVDYHGLLCDVQFIAQRGHFQLLESLGFALARFILRPAGPAERRADVEEVRVRLRKPETLGEGPTPGVEVDRTAGEFSPQTATPIDGVTAETLVATRSTAVYRLLVAPGVRFNASGTNSLQLVAGSIGVDGAEVPVHTQARGAEGTVVAAGAQGATLLCICRPPQLQLDTAPGAQG